ncbi:MAG TPA: prolyl oligopeptidase family serine peptidase [Jatrophihabitans sp.]|jgi:prolyl oligopeptidase|nr:prolyl oligopeptidase family serine peptidase [Jatrophihabitans sp.]
MVRPDTRRVDQTDDFFGTEVPDPYRWLEDPDDPEVAAWAAAQGSYTREYLESLPFRAEISAALDRAVRLPSSGLPVHRGAHWFRTANDGTQQQDVLLVGDEPFGPARTLIDPNAIGDGSTSLAEFKPSPDGTLVAYSYSGAGSDWRTWRVRDVATGEDHSDEVRWAKFTHPIWLADGSGFVYGRFAAPDGDEYVSSNRAMRLELHRLGTSQDADELVHALPDESDITFWPEITDDGRWLTVLGAKGTEHAARIWVRDLAAETSMRELVPTADAFWQQIGSVGDELLMITDRNAPQNRIVALHAINGTVRELIAERGEQLESATVAGGRLLVQWLQDAASRLTVHDLDGTELGALTLPGLGSITAMEARPTAPIAHLAWTSFHEPAAVLRYDARSGELTNAFRAELSSDLVTEQVWVTSIDGTRLPMFLIHRPDVTRDVGPRPAWLYGYGGFRVPMTPDFEPTRFAFASAGGVVAVACLRGGGEYGAPWHDAGRLANKQNVFDDMIAAATYLADEGWTARDQLGMTGRSNGGLLAGVMITQRPDLFAAIIPEVGVLDMLRFPLWTIGWAWISDYGDPRSDAEQFRTAYAYSPLHNLRADIPYPPIMVMTSDHDDRVVPAHSMKFAAALQAVSPPQAIALLRVDAASGHKHGRSHDALIAERADVLAFLSRHTGLKWQ